MAHFVAFENKLDPLPRGDEPRPDDEADDEETRSTLLALPLFNEAAAEGRPESLLSAAMLLPPGFSTMPVRLSSEGVGEVAELTRTPLPCCCCCCCCCCRVAAISDCQAINL